MSDEKLPTDEEFLEALWTVTNELKALVDEIERDQQPGAADVDWPHRLEHATEASIILSNVGVAFMACYARDDPEGMMRDLNAAHAAAVLRRTGHTDN